MEGDRRLCQPLVRAGLVRLLETSEPSVHVLGELTNLEDLTDAVSLLQPDMIVLDEHLLGQYAEARATSGDTVERPVVAVVDHPTDEQLATAESSGVRGFVSLSSTPAEVARVVVAARGDALLDGAMFTRLTENRTADTGEAISLTARELEVRDLLVEGLADKQIATRLAIWVKTVEKHVSAMLRKTGARNRTMLVGLQHQGQAIANSR
ncbi:response regulator transcription factor [Arthrobacter agilis]|uniref:response regulator transcription factor n=1 Tax=Arthrobacter agilis TaxID=37921 RepID=UPI0023653970|nr:response regulator transcription factor [Arthrobacter agilis]WDF34021.1 response regulator transcription factor [Arthrobacter agilis]